MERIFTCAILSTTPYGRFPCRPSKSQRWQDWDPRVSGTLTVPASAKLNSPNNLTTDGANLYVTEAVNHKVRQIVVATGVVSTLAGPTGAFPPAGYVNAVGTAARFNSPVGITTDGTSVYVADQGNEDVRMIDIATGTSTLAGDLTAVKSAEINGTGAAARFNSPIGITTDGISLYVADRGSNVIRQIR